MTLRIGIFVPTFPRASETFIVTKVLRMLDAGLDVQIFTLRASPDWDKFEVLANRDDVRARVHVAPPLDATPVELARGAVQIAKTIARTPRQFARFAAHTFQHRRELPMKFWKSLYARAHFVGQALDILHIEFDYLGTSFADLKDYLACRLLCSARGTLPAYTNDPRGTAGAMFRYVDGYHFISQFLEDTTRELGLPADIPTWHIEPAIDLSLFRPAARVPRTGPLRLVSVGRFAWAKGYEFALEAVAKARALGVELEYTIYGAGPLHDSIVFAIDQLGLRDVVTLAGIRAREEMPAAYADADVMVHAALDEGFCNAVIEAQAMALPVVTSDSGGLPENVEHGVTGYVVRSRDTAAMAARIVELARDPALRASLGAAGRARALARFDLQDQANAFVALYRELAALPRRASAS